MNIWITGSSSGMGEAGAYRFAQDGHNILLTALETEMDKLQAFRQQCLTLGAADAAVLPFDFSDNTHLDRLAQQAWEAFDGLDVVYLNAGISQRTTVLDTDPQMIRKIMEIDYFAPVLLAKQILPLMIERGGGQFAVTTSIAGYFGFPLRCTYSSAKHSLYGFFETLHAENYSQNIRVTLVCPGRVRTNISLYALDKGGVRHGKMDAGQANGLPVDKAANRICKAIYKKRREVLVGRKELLMVYIKRFFPGLCARLGRKIAPM
ncbi:MAG: SDR family NAD(P)-dependent oxidoreductase [Paludibacteraceae bacterium]|nr:SDR family NAD(P)-dependent oxidoreductase [Paludibacteraceae bacterium]